MGSRRRGAECLQRYDFKMPLRKPQLILSMAAIAASAAKRCSGWRKSKSPGASVRLPADAVAKTSQKLARRIQDDGDLVRLCAMTTGGYLLFEEA